MNIIILLLTITHVCDRFTGLTECGSISTFAAPASSLSELPDFHSSSFSSSWINVASDGSIIISNYGTTQTGEDDGRLFRFDPKTKTLTTLITFDSANGSLPVGAMVTIGDPNLLYGVTNRGGKNNAGTLYSYNLKTNEHNVIYNFNSQGPVYPTYGIIAVNDHQFVGVCDRKGPSNVPDQPTVHYNTHQTLYRFDLKAKTATFLKTDNEYEYLIGLPVMKDKNTMVMLLESRLKRDTYMVAEYSFVTDSVVSTTKINFAFTPAFFMDRGTDSCYYVMNAYLIPDDSCYLFMRYNSVTRQCTKVAQRATFSTRYCGPITVDNTGHLFAYMETSFAKSTGFVLRMNTTTDSTEIFKKWKRHNEVDSSNTQVDPGYDFLSNIVITGGKLYAVSSVSGLIALDLETRKTERLVQY